jgi:hypothetical protein
VADLDLEESYALANMLASDYSPLRNAIAKFTQSQQVQYESESAGYMKTVPRDPERASDAASHADAYEHFMRELERFSAKHPPQL